MTKNKMITQQASRFSNARTSFLALIWMLALLPNFQVEGVPIRSKNVDQPNKTKRTLLRQRNLSNEQEMYESYKREKLELMKNAPKINIDPNAWYPETKLETLQWRPSAEQVFKRENVDSSLPHPCGKNKCFFPVKPTPGASSEAKPDETRRGYLISQYKDDKYFQIKMGNAQKTWDLLKELEVEKEKYDLVHMYANPPYIHRNNEWEEQYETSLGEWLDEQDTFRQVGHVKEEKLYRYPTPNFANVDAFMVQEVYAINEAEAMFFGCHKHKYLRAWDQATGDNGWQGNVFLLQLLQRFSPTERETVGKKIEVQTTKLLQLLNDYPCFMYDFQIYYSLEGHFIHMDMDRCFHPTLEKVMTPIPNYSRSCEGKISDMSRFLQEGLETGEIPSWRPDYVANGE